MKQDNDCNDIVQIIAGIISFILFCLWTFSLPHKIPGNTSRTRDETQPYVYGRTPLWKYANRSRRLPPMEADSTSTHPTSSGRTTESRMHRGV